MPSAKLEYITEQSYEKKKRIIDLMEKIDLKYNLKDEWRDLDLIEIERAIDKAGINYFHYHRYNSK
ncbi:hypothetical protein H7K13_23775 [Priestia aryabhattai]|uniref:hypothetical protein n=1 Tax=Priestia aryabhattai TaxID=412384 RepID=UPI001C8D9413|nr:hypothetical protein [Priestia aryabhattai]MBY0077949.1 hypothetical protein [Priestia aryabhattai]